MAGSPFSSIAIHRLGEGADRWRDGAIAIGNFDGVHPGHQHLLAATVRAAAAIGGPAVALTFEPHPRTVFRPNDPVFRLTPSPAKRRLVEALGLAWLAELPFDRAIASLPPEAFIASVLVASFRPRAVIVGEDFRFGAGREGTIETLAAAGREAGFAVKPVPPVLAPDGLRYGSGRVRTALESGEVAAANALLGYRWFVIATVEHGDKRGRELGYPTINLRLAPDCRLCHGIYAVMVSRRGRSPQPGVASYGRRPTFDNGPPLLEVHLFDFAGDLYHETVTVAFHAFIRPEARFGSVNELVAEMDRDSAASRAILAAAPPGTPLDIRLAELAMTG